MPGAKWRIRRSGAITLSSNAAYKSSSVSSSSGAIRAVPALLTRMSTRRAGALGDPLGRAGRRHVDAVAARDGEHARPGLLQPRDDRRADPPRAARDDGGAPFDAQVHARMMPRGLARFRPIA